MKLRIRTLVLLLALTLPLMAGEVTVEQARLAARNFLAHMAPAQMKGSSEADLKLLPPSRVNPFVSTTMKSARASSPLLYVFSINGDQGFIIVSAEDRARAILAYSNKGTTSTTDLPLNYRKWIEGYSNQIRRIRTGTQIASPELQREWNELLCGEIPTVKKSSSAVEPLLSTMWNQRPYFNEYCPFDDSSGERTVTGCVATAMAQIMKYWNYPSTGAGYHSYSHDSYGSISATFGSATYEWASMPDVVDAPNAAVATLMYHCGVSVEMNYGVASDGGSGAYVISDRSPGEHCAEYALENYFKYDPGLRGEIRENYSNDDWIALLKSELDDGRPMEYAGFGSGGGHAFVCDGYDAGDFFHFNWGWGGYFDGYFSIDALDPGGTEVGGEDGGFNSGHQAIVGIKPPDQQEEYDMRLYGNPAISEDTLDYGASFRVDCDVANYSAKNFTGDLCVAIFDTSYNFVEYVGILEDFTMEAGFYYETWFENEGTLNLVPGPYYAFLFFREPEGKWEIFADGDYNNWLSFEVVYASDIELYSPFVLSSGTDITRNRALQIVTQVANTGSKDFSGDLAVDLYSLEGEFVESVETLEGVNLESGYYYDINFDSEGISAEPGTYLLALVHKPEDGEWTLSGSSYAPNPTQVIVKAEALEADPFEENDSVVNAFKLWPEFNGDTALIRTEGSNIHVGTDQDYYAMYLPMDYDYSIEARVHDSYNSGNGEVYTTDVIWSYGKDLVWSDLYDDLMPGEIIMEDGGFLFFGVIPYFEGETGSYLLDLKISRTEVVSSGPAAEEQLLLYPNPARDLLHIESPLPVNRIDIFDARGRKVQSIQANSPQLELDISHQSEGAYFLHIMQEESTSIHKVIVQ